MTSPCVEPYRGFAGFIDISADDSTWLEHRFWAGILVVSGVVGGDDGPTHSSPVTDIIANTVRIHPGDSGPYFVTNIVAKYGVSPPAIMLATLYPIATDVNRTDGSNDSTKYAHMGALYNDTSVPIIHCPKNAIIGLRIMPAYRMNEMITGLNNANPIPPMHIINFLPYISDNIPDIGYKIHAENNNAAVFTANPFGTGCSCNICVIYIAIHTKHK